MKGLQIQAGPSKLLEKKWRQKQAEIHKRKIRSVKSTIRQNCQQQPYGVQQMHLRNGKKEALMEQRYTEIERENRILLEKMSNIMQNPRPNLFKPAQINPLAKRSLNREQRRKDLVKITIENQAILKRLQKKSATYSVEKWENEFFTQVKYRDMVCENPYEFGDGLNWAAKQQATNGRLQTAAGVRGNPGFFNEAGDQIDGLPRIQTAQGYSRGARNLSHGPLSANGPRYQTLQQAQALKNNKGPIIRQAESLDENRIVLYKKGKQLGVGYYIVEISSNNTHLFIAAYDVESPESLLIELPERRAQDILNEFMNDYEQMASSLQVMNKRLVLLNPKFSQQNRINTAPAGQGRPPIPGQNPAMNEQQEEQEEGEEAPQYEQQDNMDIQEQQESEQMMMQQQQMQMQQQQMQQQEANVVNEEGGEDEFVQQEEQQIVEQQQPNYNQAQE